MSRVSRSWLFPAVIIAALIWLGAQTLWGNSDGSSNNLRFSDALALVRQNRAGSTT